MRAGLAIAIIAAAGCVHHGREDPPAQTAKDDGQHAASGKQHGGHAVQGREAAPQTSGDDRPLSGSWDGLLVDGGAERIQEALADKGFYDVEPRSKTLDERTREALRRFQAAQKLPATGLPDHQTVSALGLHQDQVFRSGSKKDTDTQGSDDNDRRVNPKAKDKT